jgi:hypothetical protein
LPEQAVHDFLEKVNKLSAPGSIYTADVMSKSLMENEHWKKFGKIMEDRGCPIVFGTDNPAGKIINRLQSKSY